MNTELPSDLLARDVAFRFEDMLTGANPEDIQWIWVPEFPAELVLTERDWHDVLDAREAEQGAECLESLVQATLSGELAEEPMVMAAVPFEEPPADRAEDVKSWINIWDGNHRLAVLLAAGEAADRRDAKVPVAFGWPLDMRRDALAPGVRALPEIQRARLTRAQGVTRELLDLGGRFLEGKLHSSLIGPVLVLATSRTLGDLGVTHRVVRARRTIKIQDSSGVPVGQGMFVEALEVGGLYLHDEATGGLEDLFHGFANPLVVSLAGPRFSEEEEGPELTFPVQRQLLAQVLEVLEAKALSWEMEAGIPEASHSGQKPRF